MCTFESKNYSNFYYKIRTAKFCSLGEIPPLSPALLPGPKYPDRRSIVGDPDGWFVTELWNTINGKEICTK